MHLTTLRYYVAVCEARSFTKAAEKLYTSQPTLSKAIMALEEEIGAPLITRGGKTIRLTSAGEICLQEAREILRRCDALPEVIHKSMNSLSGTLRIGYVVMMDIALIDRAAKQFANLYPNVDLRLETALHPLELMQKLRSGHLDVAYNYLWSWKSESDIDIETIPVAVNELLLAVNKNHPMAKSQRKTASIKEFKDEPFVLFDRTISPMSVDYEIGLCRSAGFSPRAATYVQNTPALLFSVSTGKGVGLVSEHFVHDQSNDVHLIRLEEMPTLELAAMSVRQNVNPALRAFWGIVEDHYLALEAAGG